MTGNTKGGAILEGLIIKESVAILIKLSSFFVSYMNITLIVTTHASPVLTKITDIVKITDIIYKVCNLIFLYSKDYIIMEEVANEEMKKLTMEKMISDLKMKVIDEFSIHVIEEFNVLVLTDSISVFNIIKDSLKLYTDVTSSIKLEFNIYEVKFTNFNNMDNIFLSKLQSTIQHALIKVKSSIEVKEEIDTSEKSPKTHKRRIKYYVDFFKTKILEILHYYDNICLSSKYKSGKDIDEDKLLNDIQHNIIFILTLKTEISNKRVKPENVEVSLTVLSPSISPRYTRNSDVNHFNLRITRGRRGRRGRRTRRTRII